MAAGPLLLPPLRKTWLARAAALGVLAGGLGWGGLGAGVVRVAGRRNLKSWRRSHLKGFQMDWLMDSRVGYWTSHSAGLSLDNHTLLMDGKAIDYERKLLNLTKI